MPRLRFRRSTRQLFAGLATVVGALALATGASSGPPANAAETATIVTAQSCRNLPTCRSYDLLLTLPGSAQPVNGVTIQLVPEASITAFALDGQPAAAPTGAQSAWAIFPATIAPGSSVHGTLETAAPLTANDVVKLGTTPDGFATFQSLDLHVGLPTTTVGLGHATLGPQMFSYSPQWGGFLTGHGKTVFRGGYRLLYDPPYYNIYLNKGAPLGALKEVLGGSHTGAGTVSVSIAEPAGSNKCRWLVNAKGSFHVQACTLPIWLPASVNGNKWTYSLNRLLPPGKYTVESRASSHGHSETGFSVAQHNLVKLDVVLAHK